MRRGLSGASRGDSPSSFYRSRERQIGVMRPSDLADFGIRADSRPGSIMSTGESDDYDPIPIDPTFRQSDLAISRGKSFAGDEVASFANLDVTVPFTSVDLSSRPGSQRNSMGTKRKHHPSDANAFGFTTYGSMAAIPVPTLATDIRDAVSSTAAPTGRLNTPTSPWLGMCDACLFCCMMVLGTAATTHSSRTTVAASIFAAAADVLLSIYVSVTLYFDTGSVVGVRLEPGVARTLREQGWSDQALESYEEDLRAEELNRRRLNKSLQDYFFVVLAHLSGSILAGAPLWVAYGTDPDATPLFLSIVVAGITLSACSVVRAWQVLSDTEHYISPRTAGVSILFVLLAAGSNIAIGYFLHMTYY